MHTPRSLFTFWLVLSSTGLICAAEKSAIAFRDLDFPAASAAATKEGKIVFIDFYTTWCAPCKALDAQTWTDAEVGKLVNAKAVALKLDAEKSGRALAQHYNVSAYPTLLLLKPDGTLVDRLVGFREPNMFLAEFQAALDGKSSMARAEAAVAKATQTGGITKELVQARYDLARTKARAGNVDEALEDFLWCFDEGMVAVKSYVGVRLSFLLGEIERLGTPKAHAALVARRDLAEQRMLADARDRDAAADFAALTDTLKEPDRMVAVFDMLAPRDPRRSSMGHRLYGRLIELQRYPDALDVLPYERMRAMFDSALKMSARPDPKTGLPDPRLQEANRHYVASIALDSIEVLAGANQPESVREFEGALLKFDGSEETVKSLEKRLKRAHHPELLVPALK